MSKYKNTLIMVGVVVVLGVLFMIPRLTDPNRGISKVWAEAGVACLPNGHVNLSQHFHPILKISVNGLSEAIPPTVGLAKECMAEVHTHDGTGTLHIESTEAGKLFYLKNFFTVYGMELERSGYSLVVKANGKEVANPADLILRDKEVIEVFYTTK